MTPLQPFDRARVVRLLAIGAVVLAVLSVILASLNERGAHAFATATTTILLVVFVWRASRPAAS
jgi:preprotein translocase subunit SecY